MSFLSTTQNDLNVLMNKENMSSGKLPSLVKTTLGMVTLGKCNIYLLLICASGKRIEIANC